jgi:hypothetical protein
MPANRATSGLMAKLGAAGRQAFEAHKGEDTQYSNFGELPAGLNGVAKLKDCKFIQIKEGKKNAGEYMFQAVGIVISPEEFKDADGNTHRVAGGRTAIMEMMCETPESKGRKSLGEHMAWVQNELRKLGLETKDMSADDLETSCAALEQTDVYFKFRTYKFPKKNPGDPGYNPQYDGPDAPPPRVNHSWDGLMPEGYEPPETDALTGAEDNSAAAPPAAAPNQQARTAAPSNRASQVNGARTASTSAAPVTGAGRTPVASSKPATAPAASPKPQAAKPAVRPAGVKQQPPAPPPPPPAEEFNEFGDVNTLLEQANGGDEQAANQLAQMAIQAGATEQQVKDATDWQAVVDLIINANGGDASGGPNLGDVVGFKPFNPKTKRPEAKAVDCEVTAVDLDGGTVNLRNLNSNLEYVNVPWDKLEAASS